MKITIVLGAFFPVPPVMGGAVEKVWFGLAPEFVRRGHEVVLVSRLVPELPHEETISGVKHLRVPGYDSPRSLLWLKFLDLFYSLRVSRVLPAADVIVTNTFWLPLLLRRPNCGHIYVHVARYPKGQTRFYKRAARLQAPSNAVARAIAAEAPEMADKVSMVPNPVPRSTVEDTSPPVNQRDKVLLYVGRIHPEKGVHLLIEAFSCYARTLFADWKLMIVGPAEKKFGGGGEAYLHRLQRSADAAAGQVTFAGAIFDQNELARTFRSARLFIYPSLAQSGESFGLAPLEAMTHGCGVLVSNLDCFHDFIREGETGFIFDQTVTGASEELAKKVGDIISDEGVLSRVAQSGWRESAKYSVSRVADQFLNDFTSVINESHGERTNR